MEGALSGLKVLDLSRVLAGPWAAQMLGDFGADVIKVEHPDGDDTRSWGPPFLEYADGGHDAPYYHTCNRGKQSLVVDFASEAGRKIILKLASTADVLVENFKLGSLKKYGLDYESLRPVNPRLVYCSITGFGQTGPYASRGGYDFIAQGMGGIMDLTGEPGGEPQKVGTAMADLFTGTYSVIAIQAALAHRQKTGLGQHIDMALLDTLVGVLGVQGMSYLISGKVPRRTGNTHPAIVPYQVIYAEDGPIIIAVGNNGQFGRLLNVLGLPSLMHDKRFRNNSNRIHNREALTELLKATIGKWSRKELLDALEAEGVPSGPINTLGETFADPQVVARGMRLDLVNGDGQSIPSIRTPIQMSASPPSYSKSAPRLGEHSRQVLSRFGYSEAEINDFIDQAVVFARD